MGYNDSKLYPVCCLIVLKCKFQQGFFFLLLLFWNVSDLDPFVTNYKE